MRCPECDSPNIEAWQEEHGTGVVAPDGCEERIVSGGVGCKACGWSGEEGELVTDEEFCEDPVCMGCDLPARPEAP